MSVCVAHAQNSFYHFRIVVTCGTFDLLAVAAVLVSSNMSTNDWVRDETIIVVHGDDPIFRLHTYRHNVGIIHQNIIESINRSAHGFYKTFKYKVCAEQCLGAFVYACDEARIY